MTQPFITQSSEFSNPCGTDAASVPKGCPPREVASARDGWVSPVSALLHAMAAFSWLWFSTLSALNSSLLFFFPKRSKGKPLRLMLVSTGNLGEKKKIKEETRIHTTKNRNFKDMTYGKEKLKFWWVSWIAEEEACRAGRGVEWGKGGEILFTWEAEVISYFMWLFQKHLAKPNIFLNYFTLTEGS